jgi:stage III sporulation protein AF
MDAVRSWATTVCLAALIAGIAGMIAPSGKLEKVYKFAVSLFFLCCLLIPIFSLKNIALGSINLPQTQNDSASSSLQGAVDSQAQQVAEDNISQLVKNCCTGCGVTPLAIHITVENINEKMSVQFAEVVLKSSDMGQGDKIKKAAMNNLGIDVKIKEGEN